SFGLPFINSAATSFKASNLFGDKSLASILADTSMDITLSIPLVVFVLVDTSTVWGRAKATINNANANNRNANNTCLNFGRLELVILKPFKLDNFNSAVWCLCLNIYQIIAKGSANNSQKNSLFAKSIPSYIILLLV